MATQYGAARQTEANLITFNQYRRVDWFQSTLVANLGMS